MKIYKNKIALIFLIAIISLSACTKLDPKLSSQLGSDLIFADSAILTNAQDLVNVQLVEYGNGEQTRIGNISSGELVDPLNRFGNQEEYTKAAYLHQFNPNHPAFNQMWNTFYTAINLASLTIDQVENVSQKSALINKVLAELHVSRAFFFLNAMDAFGNVPLDTLPSYKRDKRSVKTNTRLEVFNYIEKELKQNIPLLDENTANKTKMNKYLAYTMLAQLYINSQVYTGIQRWEDAESACDMVINSNKYRLSTNYFDNFAAIQTPDENMLVAIKETFPTLGGNTFVVETVHAKGGPAIGVKGTPWGGFVSTADNYKIYQSQDIRRRQWLVGRQFTALPGERIIDGTVNTGKALRAGNGPLIYNLNVRAFNLLPIITDPVGNPVDSQICAGARNVKYYPQEGLTVDNTNSFNNDYVIMRYADVILMKAECQFRLGNTAGAIATINPIRARAFGNASFNFATLTIEDIRDERTRELMLENYARRDDIRFEVAGSNIKYWSRIKGEIKDKDGKSLSPKQYLKPSADADNHTMIYPIPTSQMQLNPNLRQNTGY